MGPHRVILATIRTTDATVRSRRYLQSVYCRGGTVPTPTTSHDQTARSELGPLLGLPFDDADAMTPASSTTPNARCATSSGVSNRPNPDDYELRPTVVSLGQEQR